MAQLKIYPSSLALGDAAVTLFIELAQSTIKQQGRFMVALSGGHTPRAVYEELSKIEHQNRLNWEKIHLYWGDERDVPPDHSESNYRMVKEALLNHITIPEDNIHRVKTELGVEKAASHYEADLHQCFSDPWPRFDLVLLGMGEDGHTASLFPHSAGLGEENRWFIPNQMPKTEKWRLTLTKNAINAARWVVVLVQGEGKANTLADVMMGAKNPVDLPIQLISPVNGEMIWMLDQASASQLPVHLV